MTTATLVSNATVHPGSAAVPGFNEPYEIAYLRGGSAEVIRLALFALVQRGALAITEQRRSLTKVRRICQTMCQPNAQGPPSASVRTSRFASGTSAAITALAISTTATAMKMRR